MTRLYADNKLIAEYPDYDDPHIQHRTNCKNCGAPLPKHGRCMYCDTENDRSVKNEPFESLRSDVNISATGITFTCMKDKLNPYIQSVAIRDEKGRLHREVIRYE